jgi:hypothetical protein
VKRDTLETALHKASGKAPPKADPPTPPSRKTSNNGTASERPPSRVGKRLVAGHFDPVAARQLKQLALDQDTTAQALLTEAINDLFVKHHLKPIA